MFPSHLRREAEAAGMLEKYTSERGRVDAMYRYLAIAVLKDTPTQTAWIHNQVALDAHMPKASRPTVLTELGRLLRPQWIEDAAQILMQQVQAGNVRTSRQAVAVLRKIRTRLKELHPKS